MLDGDEGGPSTSGWPFELPSGDGDAWGEEAESSYSYAYFPTYAYSYEQVSYDFSHSFELEDVYESYSLEFELGQSFDFSFSHGYSYSYPMEKAVPEPDDVHSVTAMDVSVGLFCMPYVLPSCARVYWCTGVTGALCFEKCGDCGD